MEGNKYGVRAAADADLIAHAPTDLALLIPIVDAAIEARRVYLAESEIGDPALDFLARALGAMP